MQCQTPRRESLHSLYFPGHFPSSQPTNPQTCKQSLNILPSSQARRLNKNRGLVLVFPKSCHINLCSLAPPQTYLRSPGAIMSTHLPNLSVPQGISTRHAQKQVGTPVDKVILLAWHDFRLDRLTRHVFTARCKEAMPTIQSTTELFLQHVTRQAKVWPLAPSSNTSFFNCISGSLNTNCAGPESRLPAQKLAETQALAIKQCQDGCTHSSLISLRFFPEIGTDARHFHQEPESDWH